MAICNFSKVYKPLFFDRGRYYDLMGGRGRGGSYHGTMYFLHLITQKGYFRGCFLRQVLSDVRGSLFQDFKDRIEEVEERNGSVKSTDFDINESLMTICYRPTGNTIISKGVIKSNSRTAKLKSIAGVTHVLIEEADEIGKPDFDQLDLSLRTIKVKGGVKILRIYNPPFKMHWFWDDYNLKEATKDDYLGFPVPVKEKYYKAIPKSNSHLVAIYSTFLDNIKNLDAITVQKLLRYLTKDPEYFYTVVLGLVSEGQKGRIFSGWQAITNSQFDEIDAKSLFALDFGLASPAGLVEVKFVKNNMYVRELNYDPLTNLEIAIKLCTLGVNGSHCIVADSAEPDSISKLRRGFNMSDLEGVKATIMEGDTIKPIYKQLLQGFNIYPATKGKGSIKAGISTVKEMNVFYTEDSKNLATEYREYKWALDKNKEPTEEPIDDYNHLMDPIRYARKDRDKYY